MSITQDDKMGPALDREETAPVCHDTNRPAQTALHILQAQPV